MWGWLGQWGRVCSRCHCCSSWYKMHIEVHSFSALSVGSTEGELTEPQGVGKGAVGCAGLAGRAGAAGTKLSAAPSFCLCRTWFYLQVLVPCKKIPGQCQFKAAPDCGVCLTLLPWGPCAAGPWEGFGEKWGKFPWSRNKLQYKELAALGMLLSLNLRNVLAVTQVSLGGVGCVLWGLDSTTPCNPWYL